MTDTRWTIDGSPTRRRAFLADRADEERRLRAEVGLPGIADRAPVEWDEDGRTRRGTFERVARFARRGSRRVVDVQIVVRDLAGDLSYRAVGSVRPAGDAVLPACAGFVGDGRRCGVCRVLRSVHA